MTGASFDRTVGLFDRAADLRQQPGIIEAALADVDTLVLFVHEGTVPIDDSANPVLLSTGDVTDCHVGLLGRLGERLVLVASQQPRGYAGAWASLRDITPSADDQVMAVLLEALALARWFVEANFCTFCGERADLTTAGWARTCSGCAREHFPRMDPAVIVAPTDGERLLLGSNAAWEQQRFSCFAGFVEAGETLESAVHREVFEEAGVRLHDVQYFGSQSWPFPRSLMLGFHAAVDADTATADGEEILEVRWFTRAEILGALANADPKPGDIILPGRASIAYRLIRSWAEQTA